MAITWYLDSSVVTTGDGRAWATAAKTVADLQALALAAGDTVYISGGPTGNSQTYITTMSAYPGQWFMTNGVTYRIGQDSAHNGTAIFDGATGQYIFVQSLANVVISGDAGDGGCHFKTRNVGFAAQANNWAGCKLLYVDAGLCSGFLRAQPLGDNNEIAYNRADCGLSGGVSEAFINASCAGAAFGTNLFHHNVVTMVRDSGTGQGMDGFQIEGSGWDLYNNSLTSYAGTYAGSQHQDGWQASYGASKFRIYNNSFIGMSNYAVFMESYGGGYTDGYIYNNVAVAGSSGATQAYVLGGTTAYPATRVYLDNNISDGYSVNPIIFRDNGGTNPSAFITCGASNNITLDGGGNGIDANVVQTNNVAITYLQGTANFALYSRRSLANDYHLISSATSLLGQATNNSGRFTTDKDGVTRVIPWDVGPYAYGGTVYPTAKILRDFPGRRAG